MTAIPDREGAVQALDAARAAFVQALAGAPDQALGFLKPGDDYSAGGLVHHVNAVLEHYRNALDALLAGGAPPVRLDDQHLLERGNARAREPITRWDLDTALLSTDRLHAEVVDQAGRFGPRFGDEVPVVFAPDTDPYPTSAAAVLGWLTDHYREHVPHLEGLVREWRDGTAATAEATMRVVDAFNEAFGRRDAAAVMQWMTADCLFENTLPPPDGTRYEGSEAVGEFWAEFFAGNPTARFEAEDAFAAGDRAVVRWVFHWGEGETAGHVRGVDVFKVRDGKVAEKLSYVKG